MKKQSWRRLIVCGFLVGVCGGFSAVTLAQSSSSTTLTPLQRVNLAESQKMLAERLTRTWAMRGLGTLKGRAVNQFEEDSKRYVRQLRQLQAISDTQELKENYELLEQLWSEYLSLVAQGSGVNSVKAMADKNEELVWISEKGAQFLRSKVGASQAESLRLAGTARTLSQRMAKLHFFKELGATAAFVTTDFKKAREEYVVALDKLKVLCKDKPNALSNLQLVELQGKFFDSALRGTEVPDQQERFVIVAKASDSLLIALDDLSKSLER